MKKIVWGICEVIHWAALRADNRGGDLRFGVWSAPPEVLSQGRGTEIEDCLQTHLHAGIKHVIWALGRSVLDYPTIVGTPFGDWGWKKKQVKACAGHLIYKQMMAERNLLKAAVDYSHQKGMTIYGRLCMNRHYPADTLYRSRFAEEHEHYCEVHKDGSKNVTRLCYYFPEVRQERIALLTEALQWGLDGIHLDFCRQPPMLCYHPEMCAAYKKECGKDPRNILNTNREEFIPWIKWRANFMTMLMRDFRKEVSKIEKVQNRKISIQARVTDICPEVELINGIDLELWLKEKLIDEIMLDPLEWIIRFNVHNPHLFVKMGHQYGIPVYGGISGSPVEHYGYNPLQIARRALQLLADGCDGISIYQTDQVLGVIAPDFDLRWLIPALTDAKKLKEIINDPKLMEKYPVTYLNANCGIDNHSSSEQKYEYDLFAKEEYPGHKSL